MSERRYDQSQAFGGVIDILEAIGAVYAIWGGLAVVAYGEPRFTQDMDVLLQGNDLSIAPFIRRLREMHYYVDEQAVRSAVLESGFFNVDSGSTRHLDDIAGIVRVQSSRLDSERLSRLAAQLGCFGVWREVWSRNARPNSA